MLSELVNVLAALCGVALILGVVIVIAYEVRLLSRLMSTGPREDPRAELLYATRLQVEAERRHRPDDQLYKRRADRLAPERHAGRACP